MAYVSANSLVLVKLSVLILSCLTVFGNESDVFGWSLSSHRNAVSYPQAESPQNPSAQSPSPSQSQNQSPIEPPANAPSQAPTQPPSYPTRKLVAVQGVVYCKSCKYKGVETLLGASPVAGAVVRLQCNNTKYPLVQESKTDKNGYFFIMAPPKLTTYGSHKCKVFLVSSPLSTCQNPTDLHAGLKGAILMPRMKSRDIQQLPFDLFTVGPFAFEPSPKDKCAP